MTNQAFDPYHKWLGIPPEEQPPNLYRLLGVPVLETDLDVIEHAAARQISHLRSCSLGPHAEIAQNLLNEVAAARVTLLNPEKKVGYDAALLQAGWTMPQPRSHSLLNVSPHTPTAPPPQQAVSSSQRPVVSQAFVAESQHQQRRRPSSLRPDERSPPIKKLQVSRPLQTQGSRKKASSPFAVAAIPLGGISGICIAVVLLWVVAKVDPFGLFQAPSVSQLNDADEQNVSPPMEVERKARPSQGTFMRSPPASQDQDKDALSVIERSPPANERNSSSSLPSLKKESPEPKNVAGIHDSSQTAPIESPVAQPESAVTQPTKVDADQADIFSVPRDWLFASGETVNAVVSGVDNNLVVLKEIPEGEERSLPIAELAAADRILLSDQLQFRESPYAGDHSSLAGFNLSGNSEITLNELKRAHETYTLSPYAGLCYAFYLCDLTDNYNDYKAARNILRTVTERIDRQREYDPDRHSVTLSSVHNNMAICFVREHNFVAAVASLKASLDASPDNTAARRNAYAIKVLDGQLQNRAKPLLSSSPRIVLEGLVGTFAPAMPITAWTHAFDVEQPGPLLEKNKSFSSTHGYDWSRLSAPSTWCVPCEGRGFFACPSCGGDGQVSGRERGQAGVDPIYGPIQTIRPTVGRCANCSGIGRFDCKDCERGRLRP